MPAQLGRNLLVDSHGGLVSRSKCAWSRHLQATAMATSKASIALIVRLCARAPISHGHARAWLAHGVAGGPDAALMMTNARPCATKSPVSVHVCLLFAAEGLEWGAKFLHE